MLIGICDNQKTDMERIRMLIKHYPQNEYEFEIKTFISGQSLLDSKKKFDIIFLSIELEGARQTHELHNLPKEKNKGEII